MEKEKSLKKMATNQVVKRKFMSSEVSQRTSDSYFNATELLQIYNEKTNQSRRFADFWENKNTQQIYKNLQVKTGIDKLHTTQRGKGGSTWMQEDLLLVLYNWLEKIPNQTITRDEHIFCDYIIESFKDILTFEKQKRFGSYYVDLFCEELRLCLEFDEGHHKGKKLVLLDKDRQEQIEETFDVFFIRHNYTDNYSITINKILKWKQSHNIVQAIKQNKIPNNFFF
jgi:very-short-patch-repair endonuclease